MLSGIEPKVMDYDIAVAYFLEETNHLNIGQIPASVERILFDFETLPPLTSRQENLRTCALHILSTINPYDQPQVQPFRLLLDIQASNI